eukprot:6182416-Pleurochrysis_carterae.AAC.2
MVWISDERAARKCLAAAALPICLAKVRRRIWADREFAVCGQAHSQTAWIAAILCTPKACDVQHAWLESMFKATTSDVMRPHKVCSIQLEVCYFARQLILGIGAALNYSPN